MTHHHRNAKANRCPRSKNGWLKLWLGMLLTGSLCQPLVAEVRETIPLSGEWRFELDADSVGVAQNWHSRKLDDRIQLPGTTDEANKGIRNTERVDDRLSRP